MIYFKEWIKTRWFLLLMFLATNGFIIYALLRINRAIELKGAAHLWEVAILKDTVFIELPLQFVPLIVGIVMGLCQFIPEMYHKCLKLTLHLPMSHEHMVFGMLKFGVLNILICFGINIAILFFGLKSYFPHEIYWRIILTSLPWFLAGLASYLLTAWITLEPSWRYRLFNGIISLLVLRIYFVSGYPEAYNAFLPFLTIFTLLLSTLSWLSVSRFKRGKQ